MRLRWLITLLSLLVPGIVFAANIPGASEVVLIYENAAIEQQSRYDFIFTINNDPTIYPCVANRCSMQPFRDLGNVTMTVYKMPEGFPRVANIVDQKVLNEYITLAEKRYVLENIATNLSTVEDGRQYQEAYVYADGTVKLQTANYDKPEFNQDESAADENSTGKLIWKIVIGLVGAAVVVALVMVIMRIMKARQLRV